MFFQGTALQLIYNKSKHCPTSQCTNFYLKPLFVWIKARKLILETSVPCFVKSSCLLVQPLRICRNLLINLSCFFFPVWYMAAQLHLHLGRSVRGAPSLRKPPLSPSERGREEDGCVIPEGCAAHQPSWNVPTTHAVTAASSVRSSLPGGIPILGYR